MTKILSILFLTVCTALMAVPAFSGTEQTKIILHENIQREAIIYRPRQISDRRLWPMVIVLHGGGGTARGFAGAADKSSFKQAADKYGFIAVFPQGVNRQWNDGRDEIFKGWRDERPRHDDVGFISRLIDIMIEQGSVDPDRVYVTGISNGGFMSFRLALELSGKLRAVAPVTAQISYAMAEQQPDSPISIMVINGTDDPIVPYEGGEVRLVSFGRSRGRILSTHESVKKFADFNYCNDNPKVKHLKDKDPQDGTTVQRIKYYGCSKGTHVELIKVIGGGHAWPGGSQYLPPARIGFVSRDFNATEAIAEFFLKHK